MSNDKELSANQIRRVQEAKKLTEQIRDNINQSAKLVQKAHAGKIWLALGIPSFAEWLKEAVGVSRARGYQLLNIAKVEDQVRGAIELPEHFILTDRQTRLIQKVGLEKIVQRTEELNEEDSEAIALRGEAPEIVNYQSLVEAINEVEAAQTNDHDPQPYFEEPTDPNNHAKNYFTQFLYQIDDLPKLDEAEPMDFKQIISDLEASVKTIDELLNDYLLVSPEGGE